MAYTFQTIQAYDDPNSGRSKINANFANIASATTVIQWEETIVNISSAQILSVGTSNIELLPAPTSNKYREYESIKFEYSYSGTPYTFGSYLYVYEQTELGLVSGLINASVNNYFILKPNGTTPPVDAIESYSFGYSQELGLALKLGTYDSSNPTLGNGTLRIIIRYKEHTFGA